MFNHCIKLHKDLISISNNTVNRQTDRQTDKGESIISLAEVITFLIIISLSAPALSERTSPYHDLCSLIYCTQVEYSWKQMEEGSRLVSKHYAVWSVRRVPPHFSILPESTEVVEGGAVNLTCVAVGSPMPYVRWRRGSVNVPSVAGQLDAPTPIGKNVLQLTDVRRTATYTCVASSELGSIEHHAEVRIRGKLHQWRNLS